MTEEYVNILRKSSRDLINTNRKLQRDIEIDKHRPVKDVKMCWSAINRMGRRSLLFVLDASGKELVVLAFIEEGQKFAVDGITEDEIKEVANKLKTKSKVSAHELKIVKNGIMSDQRYIEIILNVHGALRGIVRELSGTDAKKQLDAAACCCNLGLGDSRACLVIAKAIGTYLTAEIDSLNNELGVTCMWTLGNLAGSGSKVCNILVSQGALAKLIDLLANENMSCAALYALQHFALQMKDELRPEYLDKMVITLTRMPVNMETSKLLFILSCHSEFPTFVTEDLLLKLLLQLPASIEEHLKCINTEFCCQLVYLIRILANSDKYNVILNYFVVNNFSVAIKHIMCTNNDSLSNSLLWLLGNLFKYNSNNDFFKMLLM